MSSTGKTSPFFSVIIPTYDRAKYILQAVESVLNQSFSDLELIVVDDGSSDETLAILSQVEDDRLGVIEQENQGRSVARNNGIEAASGQYVCFLDSDDFWMSKHLERIHQGLDEGFGECFYFSDLIWRFDKGDDIRNYPAIEGSSVEYVMREQVSTITVAISRGILDRFKFDPRLFLNEDVHLWSRIVSEYPMRHIDTCTAVAIQHESNTQRSVKDPVSPQIEATESIFSDEHATRKISSEFKRNKRMQLDHAKIEWLGEQNFKFKQSKEILKFLFKYPENVQNKSKVVTLIKNLPLIGSMLD